MNTKQESERLMNSVIPLAKKMLAEYGEFYPYGGYMKFDGEIVDVGAKDPDDDYPKSKDLIYILKSSFQEMARTNHSKAVAIVFNVRVNIPTSEKISDAIQVCIDHVDGYSVEVFFPYQIISDKILYGEIFAQKGKSEIF
jgi:hypothetical protein